MASAPPLHAAPPGTSLVVLCRRRGGARGVYDMLANHSPLAQLGHEPFHWERPLGEVSRLFHSQQAEQARVQLDEALEMGVIFRHPYDVEAWGFNSLLLDALNAHGARAVLFEREDEAERQFSLLMALQFNLWTRDNVDAFRERIRRDTSRLPIDFDRVRQVVEGDMRYRAWFEEQLDRTRIVVMRCSYEKLFRNGVHALNVIDEVFAFAGLGSRVAQLDDASFLRVAFSGEQHTLGLLDYSAQLREMHAVICSTLANPPSSGPSGPAAQPLAAGPGPAPDASSPPEVDRAY